jgi:hypothetical protein
MQRRQHRGLVKLMDSQQNPIGTDAGKSELAAINRVDLFKMQMRPLFSVIGFKSLKSSELLLIAG